MRESIGLCITDEKFIIAHTVLSGDQRRLLKHCEHRTHFGDDPIEVLKTLVQELGAEHERCVICLNPNEYELFLIAEPENYTDQQELRRKVADLMEFPIEEASIDYISLPKPLGDQSAMGYIVAAREQLIQDKVSMAQQAGLNVIAVDVPEMALRNVTLLDQEHQVCRMLIHMMPEQSKILKLKGPRVEMMRNSDLNTSWLFQEEIDTNLFMSNIDALIETLLSEIERSVNYSETMLGQEPCQEIWIMAHNEASGQVIQTLKSRSPVMVNAFAPETLLQANSQFKKGHLYRSLYAIGASLREEV